MGKKNKGNRNQEECGNGNRYGNYDRAGKKSPIDKKRKDNFNRQNYRADKKETNQKKNVSDKQNYVREKNSLEEQKYKEKKNSSNKPNYSKKENEFSKKSNKKKNYPKTKNAGISKDKCFVQEKAALKNQEKSKKNKTSADKQKNIYSNTDNNILQQQNTSEPCTKHWTELHLEYKRNRERERLCKNKGYTEVRKKINLPLNGCGFGDEYFLFEEGGAPKYKDVNTAWNYLIDWMELVCEEMKTDENYENKPEYKLGQKIIEHTRQHNPHGIFINMSMYWVNFRNTFLLRDDCPEQALEFVRGIMTNKMTEKQMWGTVEDRCPGGTLIILDRDCIPEETQIGNLKIEYRPNYVTERMEKMKRSNGML